jgi:hypothetical protein
MRPGGRASSFGGKQTSMWTSRTDELADGRTLRITIDLDGSPISYAEVLKRWQSDAEFRAFFMNLLADAPFSAFRWETPPDYHCDLRTNL